jgi:hypothetical protein
MKEIRTKEACDATLFSFLSVHIRYPKPHSPVLHGLAHWKFHTISQMKNAVLWDVAPCRSSVNRRFGGTYRLHL